MLLAKKLGDGETASLVGVRCAHPYAQPVYALYVEGGLNVKILVLRRSVSLFIARFRKEHNVWQNSGPPPFPRESMLEQSAETS